MKPEDLKTKCARVMLESGPDVKVKLVIPKPEDLVEGAMAVGLGLNRQGGPLAAIKGSSTVDGKPMLTVWVKAADLLKELP